jgi:hypothetical protein
MTSGETYRLKAAELHARASEELPGSRVRLELESLALSYVRLALDADRNAQTDLVYETPPARPAERAAQQQQQIQPDSDD